MHWAYREDSIEIYFRHRLFHRLNKRSFECWLDRLVVVGIIEPIDWDMENGKFFKIPKCCIKWYLFMGKMGVTKISEMTDYIYSPCRDESNLSRDEQYVRCPKCRKESRNA